MTVNVVIRTEPGDVKECIVMSDQEEAFLLYDERCKRYSLAGMFLFVCEVDVIPQMCPEGGK